MHRMARRLALLALVPLAVGGVLLPAASAESTAKPAHRPHPTAWTAADTRAEQRGVRSYWTWSRMVAAKAFDMSMSGSTELMTTETPSAGRAVAYAPTSGVESLAAGSNSLAARTTAGSAWPGTGSIARTAGRVFFTITGGADAGRNASCSGSAVTSANKSVVITAGHCVKINGSFHANWMFVPGFDSGNRPFGTWVATNLFTTPQWNASEDLNFDVAAAVVAPLNGQNLVDVVGGQGIAFNQARGRQMYAFGYPAASPFDGSKLIFCSGRTINDPIQSDDLGLNCNMNGGSSGGPWFLNFNEQTGAGILNSVNSFKYNFAPNFMFGPFFGTDAQAVYNAAQTQGVQ
jgi:V8-like Glu-specific endopeptidase